MAFIYGNRASITSWTGTFNTLLVGSHNTPHMGDFALTGDVFDSTRFSTATAPYASYTRNTKGLRSISGSFTSYVSVNPRVACTALVSNILNVNPNVVTYDTWVQEFTLSIKAAFVDTTLFTTNSANCKEWRDFTPGIVSWSGSFKGFIDDGAALHGTLLDAQPASTNLATFKISDTKTLTGNIITTNVSSELNAREMLTYNADFVGDGALFTAGAATELWSADTAATSPTIAKPANGTLTFQQANGFPYSGEAFWTSLDITARPDAPLEIKVGWQGTGVWAGFAGT